MSGPGGIVSMLAGVSFDEDVNIGKAGVVHSTLL